MNSCIYRGTIRHRRFSPTAHTFQYRLFMMYLDLDELPQVFDGRWLWSVRKPAPAWFRRSDYLGDPRDPLADAVRSESERLTGRKPRGPIRMLTHLRYFGYVMNPVTFYYCFAADGRRIESILAEVTNTPWKERHTYALGPGADGKVTDETHRFGKAFHVSPFMDMEQDYVWRFTDPDDDLRVHMETRKEGTTLFDATLALEREEITAASLARSLLRHPWMSARVAVAIYGQASRLWLKRLPFHVHPNRRTA